MTEIYLQYSDWLRRKFDLTIFDLDGTLIDSYGAIVSSMRYTLSMFSKNADSWGNLPKVTSLDEMFGSILREDEKHLAPRLTETYRRHYAENGHSKISLLEGVPDVLVDLKSNGFKIAVATMTNESYVHQLMDKINLHSYFDMVLGSSESMRFKPNPDMLMYIMDSLGVNPSRTVMIGDTPLDILAARNAGVLGIGVLSSVSAGNVDREEFFGAKPEIVISSLKELPEHLYIRH